MTKPKGGIAGAKVCLPVPAPTQEVFLGMWRE